MAKKPAVVTHAGSRDSRPPARKIRRGGRTCRGSRIQRHGLAPREGLTEGRPNRRNFYGYTRTMCVSSTSTPRP
jgi:hypothetical protein